MSVALSIVVTSYNRSKVLCRLLASLESQTVKDFEVVVAIDGSTDCTESVLQSLSTSFTLRWVNTHYEGYGLAVARNLGILASYGRAVVIIDDDSFPSPSFVEAHIHACASGVITGGKRPPSDPNELRMAWKTNELGKIPPLFPMSIPDLHLHYPNAYLIENNICLFREDWIKIGLFSERLKLYGFIGQEFFARAEYLGFFYQYAPGALVIHHGELEGDNGLSRKRKQRQIFFSRIIRPALMQPHHYLAQISWAKARSIGSPPPALPSYWLSLIFYIHIRVLKRLVRLFRLSPINL